MSKKNSNSISDFIKDLVRRISDIEYQKRVWVNHIGPECDSFEETSMFFIEEWEAVRKNLSEFNFTNRQIEFINNLYVLMDEYSGHKDVREILEDPEWRKIISSAQNTYKALEENQY